MKKFVALNLRHQIFIGLGPGPVVIWVNSNQRGSEFESQCLIIDGLFYRFLFGVWKERKFMKLRPGWPFLPYCRCKRFITLARTLKKTFYNVGPNTKKVSTVAPQHTPNSQPANTSYWAKIKALIWVVVVVVLVVIDCSTVVIAFTRHLWGRGFDSIFHHAEVDIKWTVKRSTNVTMFKRTQFESRLLQKILLLS